jgi:hypothetical protein
MAFDCLTFSIYFFEVVDVVGNKGIVMKKGCVKADYFGVLAVAV